MTLAHDSAVRPAPVRLCRLANEASVLIGLRDSGIAWDPVVVVRIRRILDRAIDVLAELADQLPDDDQAGRRVRSTRAGVDAHLRAVDHLLAAGATGEKYVDLLADAVALLVAEADVSRRRPSRHSPPTSCS